MQGFGHWFKWTALHWAVHMQLDFLYASKVIPYEVPKEGSTLALFQIINEI